MIDAYCDQPRISGVSSHLIGLSLRVEPLSDGSNWTRTPKV